MRVAGRKPRSLISNKTCHVFTVYGLIVSKKSIHVYPPRVFVNEIDLYQASWVSVNATYSQIKRLENGVSAKLSPGRLDCSKHPVSDIESSPTVRLTTECEFLRRRCWEKWGREWCSLTLASRYLLIDVARVAWIDKRDPCKCNTSARYSRRNIV